jgi:lipoyl(octanoyl) transferase
MDWRLILDGAGEPAWNLAVDEAIFEAFRRGQVPPTIRIYSWNCPAVSTGYFQKLGRIFSSETNVPVVRRPTGGRAVPHGTDITFSVVAPAVIMGRRVGDSYRRIGTAVARALSELGIEANFCPAETRTRDVADVVNCFSLALKYEVTVQGKKVLGSAQTRRGDAVLQQNSLILTPPPQVCLRAIGADERDFIAADITRENVECHLVGEIAQEFRVKLTSAALTKSEEESLGALQSKYASAEWTGKASMIR